MFEVGKLYKNTVSENIMKCLGVGEEFVFFMNTSQRTKAEFIREIAEVKDSYVEYKEPRKLEGWVPIVKKSDGRVVFGIVRNSLQDVKQYVNDRPLSIVGYAKVTWSEDKPYADD